MENELIELLEEFIDFLRMREEEEFAEPEELDEQEEFAEDPEQEEIAFSEMIDDMSKGE